MAPRRPLLDRIAEKFTVDDSGCWLWTASLTRDGYARLQMGDVTRTAHRVLYEAVVGPVPAGLELDHLCKVRHCVNPDHLEPVTPAENVRRARAKETCVNGHPFTPENRYYSGSKSCCRPCNIEWQRQKRAEARAA